MADIMMCFNIPCPKAQTCYRRQAKANEFRQSVWNPSKSEVQAAAEGNCEQYWEYPYGNKNVS